MYTKGSRNEYAVYVSFLYFTSATIFSLCYIIGMNENNTIKKLPNDKLFSMRKDVLNAVEAGRKDDLLAFIDIGYDVTFMVNELIVLAVALRKYDIAELLMNNGASMTNESSAFDILLSAVERNDIGSCQFSLSHGAGITLRNIETLPHYQNKEAYVLQKSVILGHMDIFELLLSDGFVDNGDAIGSALKMGKVDFFKILLAIKPDVHNKNYVSSDALLCLAAFGGHVDIIKILLKLGVDVNLKDNEGTPLEIAVMRGEYVACKFLIENGADASVLKKSHYKKILGSPRNALANITQETHKEIVRLTVSLHVSNSKQSILDLINKSEDWLKPYYMKEMGSRL